MTTPTTTDMLDRLTKIDGILTDIGCLVVNNHGRTDGKYRDALRHAQSLMASASGELLAACAWLETAKEGK